MGTRRNLTVGVTVNLEHYENLRLEVSGEVGDDREADELVMFLDNLLGKMGRGDPATADKVDSYRSRVFSFATGIPAEEAPEGCHNAVCSLPADILEDIASGAAGTPETGEAGEKATAAHTADVPRHAAPDTAEPVPASATAGAAEQAGVLSCEECGTPVTAAQSKMSTLFTSRTLCKECMKKP